MQPEPTTSSPRRPNPVHESSPEQSAQYGFSAPDDDDSSSRERLDVATSAEPSSSQGVESRLAGLSVEDQRKKRISEYENALLPSPPKRQVNEGPGFKVVKKKGGKSEGNGLQLDEFPNEVLTHILSHLPAASLSAVSTVSKRFYSLVTTPHAWRIAFSRFFPGQDASFPSSEEGEQLRSEHRVFTRLTGLASWRSEYILRTRLLRSLGRGKPAQLTHGASSRSNSAANNANAVVTYSSQLFATVNHIHGVFGTGKKATRFMHGTDETGSACTSDPNIGKIDNWGLSDPQALPQFADLFVGDEPYGMGEGPVGLPNSMDVSVPFGMVYGEGFPGGQTYFRSSEEMRGRFISQPNDLPDAQSGIPTIPGLTEAVSAVWIAKSGNVPQATNGLVGIMTGSTLGIVTTYSLGADTSHGRRITRGQVTAKWVLSPGVPIIALKVDDEYSLKRRAAGRIWAVALNALGEVFCLSETPASALVDNKVEDGDAGRHAWNAGRTAYWTLVEPSRRVAKDDPYNEAEIHGSYSPRSSSKFMRLSKAQIVAETLEIEKFLAFSPIHFRKLCEGWDMRRRLEVDFAGDDGNGAGEAMFVINCGIEEGQQAEMKRFTRWKTEQASREEYPTPKTPPMAPKTVTMAASLFGGGMVITPPRNSSPERSQMTSLVGSPIRRISPDRTPSMPSSPASRTMSTTLVEEWRTSILSLKDHPNVEITTSAIDMSTYATLTVDEDPLRTVNGQSEMSPPFGTPSSTSDQSTQIPGHRARFLAIGTKVGTVIVYNMRAPQSSTPSLPNTMHPLRTIATDSPQISTLALSALYLIHGGNDGLVQTWDPLSSSQAPIRTLNSRFSSRARRRLVQAEASALGVGINLYAAGAICLDPDPTVLRGMVSLGTHLRFWSYSSSAADAYQSKKRRLRRSNERGSNERGSNSAPDRFTNTGRGALLDYIATEQEELKKEKMRRAREEARLRGRFGVGLSGMSEDEALRYAELISAETFQKDEERRMSESEGAVVDSTPEGSLRSLVVDLKTDDELEHDIEEAIRLSLLEGVDAGGRSPSPRGGVGAFAGPITFKSKKSPRSRRSESSSPSHSRASGKRVGKGVEADDLELALQLSLAEERSKLEMNGTAEEEFPSLEVKGKGKGRAG